MNKVEIGIVETRKIIKTIQDTYNYDYKNYALTFFKHRLERVIANHNLKNADHLIDTLIHQKEFFEKFLRDISVETTEMFRSPSLWRLFRDEFIPRHVRTAYSPFKIWIANCQTGEELYSMSILLTEAGLWDTVEVHASYDSEINYELIRKGQFSLKKLEVNEANYKRFNPFGEITAYYGQNSHFGWWNPDLIEKVKFSKQYITFDDPPGNFHLVWFRNQMIYYNQILQDQVLRKIYDCLYMGGHLVTGEKETLANSDLGKKFKPVSESEKIFKKI